ncbi:MAG: DUF3536 domain-containing protein [Deltaproteobacteria bacterium]|nr:DUF3536 domain-containing protein [Deltaproteobacteria bacterium]
MIEYQKSAQPYHDWNERVTRECYTPNTRSRILGEDGSILRMINNYEYMSFNFGPTLLSWLEQAHPWEYNQILVADQHSLDRYGGHGNALAQVYNHLIMPLANRRDKLTQIRWGLVDFRHRFGRNPEGMWLAETAVDLETLDLMAQEGIKFTILAPTQARAVRPLGGNNHSWHDVSGGRIDPSRPYRVLLDDNSHRHMDIFFYDGPLSRAIAYEKILTSGADLFARINAIFKDYQNGAQLISIATDGESYGHHFKFGEMALSWLFQHIERDKEIQMVNFGFFLELFPPVTEVKIFENTAWSCAHGVERWRSDCGCSVGQNPEWNQAWRTPLREGLNWLAAELSAVFENRSRSSLKDCWEARDDYIQVILDSSLNTRESFWRKHCIRPLSEKEKIETLQLLESQRMAMFMFTSCGWFFDDISGIESAQVLRYAARAISLAGQWADKDLEKGLLEFLSQAKSNDPLYKHGGKVYEKMVKPSEIYPSLATANYALTSLVKQIQPESYPFERIVHAIEQRDVEGHGTKAKMGRVVVIEPRTGLETQKSYLAIHQKGGDLYALIGDSAISDPDRMFDEVKSSLQESSKDTMLKIYLRHVSDARLFVIKDLIPDVRYCIINEMAGTIDQVVNHSIQTNAWLIQSFVIIIQETHAQPPPFLDNLFQRLFIGQLAGLLNLDQEVNLADWEQLDDLIALSIPSLLNNANQKPSIPDTWRYLLKEPNIKKKALNYLRFQMKTYSQTKDLDCIKNIMHLVSLVRTLDMELDLWECQSLFYDLYHNTDFMQGLGPADLSPLQNLGTMLGINMEGD